MHTETNPTKGILFCLLSYFFISLIGIFEKSISHAIAIPVILFFQHLICLLLNLFDLSRSKITSLKPEQPLTYFIRIASGLGCAATLFFIIRFMPISQAMLYQYSASLWIPFIMLIWLQVRMPRRLWTGIIVGFAGMILILKPDQSMLSMVSFFGILCGVFQGISVVAIRKLSNEPMLRVLFYNFLVATFITGLLTIKYWSPIAIKDFVLLCGVGMVTYLGQKCFMYSCNFAHPTTLAPICYTSILYSGLLGWIFWGEIPDNNMLAGMALVITGCILTLLMTRQPSKQPISLVLEKG